MRPFQAWMLPLVFVACGHPEPSVADPRFDALWAASSGGIDGDLDENGDLVTVVGRFAPLTTGDANAEIAAFVATWDDLLAVSAAELVPIGTRPGIGGASVGRFGVVYSGLPVFDAFVVGEVSPPYGVTYFASRAPTGIDVATTASVPAADAVAVAEDVDLESTTPTGDPVLGVFNGGLYLDEATGSTLAWQVPLSGGTVWVDATVGDVVWIESGVREALNLELYDADHSDDFDALAGIGGAAPTRVAWMDENGALAGVTPSAKAQTAFDLITTVHGYFENTHLYTGIDGAGVVPTTVYVHFGDPGLVNAYQWNDSLWLADQTTLLDVAAHEYTHGIVAWTAGLRYAAYPGALNESFADSFAAFIDTGEKWQIGEDLATGPLRFFETPGRKGQPNHWTRRRKLVGRGQCKAQEPRCGDDEYCLGDTCVDVSRDDGYVHKNSGIPNHATFLMAAEPVGTVRHSNGYKARSIGQDKVAALMMDVLQLYLGPSSAFGSYARAMVAACKAHVRAGTPGFETRDCGAVVNALHAVGIHPGPDADEDTVPDHVDNCPKDENPLQEDSDGDRLGDACDSLVGANITVWTRHENSTDENPVHIVINGEAMDEGANKVTPGESRVRHLVATSPVSVGVGREGSVWQTVGCGPAIEGGEYQAVYWEGLGLVTYTFSCWRSGPGVAPPDPTETDPGLEL